MNYCTACNTNLNLTQKTGMTYKKSVISRKGLLLFDAEKFNIKPTLADSFHPTGTNFIPKKVNNTTSKTVFDYTAIPFLAIPVSNRSLKTQIAEFIRTQASFKRSYFNRSV